MREAPEALRYERKFVVSAGPGSQSALGMVLRLHPALFSEIYRERWVNSLYFDTPDRRYFDAGESGQSDRTKIRIRWYGATDPLIIDPFLELKVKRNTLGRKLRYPLEDASFGDYLRRTSWTEILRRSDVPLTLGAALSGLHPALINRYRRRYYLSACGRFRITTDTDIEYRRPSLSATPSVHRHVERIHSVVELKYAAEDDDAAREIASRLPFRTDRNSKYMNGLLRFGA